MHEPPSLGHARCVELVRVDPDDLEAVTRLLDLRLVEHAADEPWEHPETLRRLQLHLRLGWDGEAPRTFLARRDGRTVGAATVNTSDYDNLELAWVKVWVHPDHRRRRVGSELAELVLDECRRLGRPLVGADYWESPALAGFTRALGFEQRTVGVLRRQHLRELDPGLADEVVAEAAPHAVDYELVRLRPPTPEDLLERIVGISMAVNDAPTDDLEFEDEIVTPERLRRYEQVLLESGAAYRVVARHRATGELAGNTVVLVDGDDPTVAFQHDTAVAAAHRGHRLGLLLKADVMRWLAGAEPQVATVDTWNAASNDHMIAVNERLGYRVMGSCPGYQRRL